MTNHVKENISEETAQEMMQHYSTIAQKAMEMLQSKDPSDRAKALENLHGIKDQLIETIFSLADKIGMPKDQIEKMVADPASFLSPEYLESLQNQQAVSSK